MVTYKSGDKVRCIRDIKSFEKGQEYYLGLFLDSLLVVSSNGPDTSMQNVNNLFDFSLIKENFILIKKSKRRLPHWF